MILEAFLLIETSFSLEVAKILKYNEKRLTNYKSYD